MFIGFPSSVMVWVAHPFDQVFGVVMSNAHIENVFDFIFRDVIYGDWRRWRRQLRTVSLEGSGGALGLGDPSRREFPPQARFGLKSDRIPAIPVVGQSRAD